MFTGHLAAESINLREKVLMEAFHLLHPSFRRKPVPIERQNMDIPVSDMSNRNGIKIMLFFECRQLCRNRRNLIKRYDKVFGNIHNIDVTSCFGKLAAAAPDAVVRLDNVYSATFFTNFTGFFHFPVQFIFIERLHRHDDIADTFIHMRQRNLTESGTNAKRFIIHVFNTRRFNTRFQEFIR